MSENDMNRPFLENRSAEQAQKRAVVFDADALHTLGWLAGTCAVACIGIGMWIGFTVQGLNGKFETIAQGQSIQAAQISAIQQVGLERDRRQAATDEEQSRRISALEITITGLGALKERMDAGFLDLNKRLDRMEGSR